MAPYKCFMLGPAGQVQAEEKIEAQSRDRALAIAREILKACDRHAAFELWLDVKIIHTEFGEESGPNVVVPA